MTPTMELRFVERPIAHDLVGLRRILQQKWEGSWEENKAAGKYVEEWRDVPIAKESDK